MRPLILITNDDSINAPGLWQLVDCVGDGADIIVAAPEMPHSGQSSSLTIGSPLHIKSRDDYRGARVFSINGTPVDCVKLALNSIVPRKPDFLLSGINHGSNSGNAITYSGTMGAVLEACTNGITAAGFSLLHHSLKADFSLSARYVRDMIGLLLDNPTAPGVCLNINIPAKVTPEGIRTCRAARGHWSEEYRRYLDPNGNPFYWLTGRFINEEPDAVDTDEYWLARNYISVVPVTPEQTCFAALNDTARIYDTVG